jgi:hypothetical protein
MQASSAVDALENTVPPPKELVADFPHEKKKLFLQARNLLVPDGFKHLLGHRESW